MENDFLSLIKTRRSARAYQAEPVPADFIHVPADGVIHAGQLSLQHCGQLFVAQISEEAMTALSLVYPVQNFINAVGIGFGVGINAVIAFYLGAGDHEKADQAVTQGLVLAVIHGVVMTVCCIAIMPVFLRMFTASEAVISLIIYRKAIAKPVTTARKE